MIYLSIEKGVLNMENTRTTTHKLRKELHLTTEEFSKKYNIPVGTVRNWDTRETMPTYVENLVRENMKLEEENFKMMDTLINIFTPHMQKILTKYAEVRRSANLAQKEGKLQFMIADSLMRSMGLDVDAADPERIRNK